MILLKDDNKITGWAIQHERTDAIETIHIDHTLWTTIEDAKEDIWAPFVVYEECGNYARMHLVCDSCEDYALQEVCTWLDNELNCPDNYHIIGVDELKFEKL